MFVKKLRAWGLHHRRSDGGGGRFIDEGAVFGDALPVAIIIKESALPLAMLAGIGPRLGEVALAAVAQSIEPVAGKKAAQDADAVALVSGDIVLADKRG